MKESHDIVVIGAGQAGLSISHELSRASREHVILERGRVGESWRGRWESFTLVLPNWTVRLPGHNYDGPDPDGFMARDVFVAYVADYACSFDAPVREGITVTALERDARGFDLQTSGGEIHAREVIVATGGYQEPRLPAVLSKLGPYLPVIESGKYRNPQSLPPGRILIIGSGQSGCQIADELHRDNREVWLACGKAPWLPRRVGGHDGIWWTDGTQYQAMTLADLPSPALRDAPHPQWTGRDGGHDLNYRTLQAIGVVLTGRLLGVEDGRARFASDLADNVAFGDARYKDYRSLVARKAAHLGLSMPELPDPPPFKAAAPEIADLSIFAAVIVATGYRPVYGDWIRHPEALDQFGYPLQQDGTSTVVPGLHFMGLPFQRKRPSASLMGVGEDAAVLAERMSTANTLAVG